MKKFTMKVNVQFMDEKIMSFQQEQFRERELNIFATPKSLYQELTENKFIIVVNDDGSKTYLNTSAIRSITPIKGEK